MLEELKKLATSPTTSLPLMNFHDINSPGTYLAQDKGLLIRIPPEGVLAGQSPVISLGGSERVEVVQLSSDPWIPVSRARSIAASLDLETGF